MITAAVAPSVCGIRNDLLNRLAAALEKLGTAKLRLAALATEGDFLELDIFAEDLTLLRTEFSTTKMQLERHRAEHGC